MGNIRRTRGDFKKLPTKKFETWQGGGCIGLKIIFKNQKIEPKVKMKSLSRVRLFVTPWTAAYQAPPSVGFSRQEYWSGVPLPSPIVYI